MCTPRCETFIQYGGRVFFRMPRATSSRLASITTKPLTACCSQLVYTVVLNSTTSYRLSQGRSYMFDDVQSLPCCTSYIVCSAVAMLPSTTLCRVLRIQKLLEAETANSGPAIV